MAKDSGEVSGGVRDKFRRGFRASYLGTYETNLKTKDPLFTICYPAKI